MSQGKKAKLNTLGVFFWSLKRKRQTRTRVLPEVPDLEQRDGLCGRIILEGPDRGRRLGMEARGRPSFWVCSVLSVGEMSSPGEALLKHQLRAQAAGAL